VLQHLQKFFQQDVELPADEVLDELSRFEEMGWWKIHAYSITACGGRTVAVEFLYGWSIRSSPELTYLSSEL
jgi:hypothetical protein